MPTAENLLRMQNADGGWPYLRGGSWTEPTVYAVLALLACNQTEAALRGVRWLAAQRRPDGGWPARASVAESSWVTALVALMPPELIGTDAHSRSILWVLGVSGMESTRSSRLRSWLLGNRIPPEQQHPGWPWVPGTASWVAPTAIAILALEKECARNPSPQAADRIASGRQFLLSRACAEGGWNHGGARELNYPAHPYPETTGLALAGLRGVNGPKVQRALSLAVGMLEDSRSADALNWLQFGLSAHGALPAGYSPPPVACRTAPELSLRLLSAAANQDRSFLWG